MEKHTVKNAESDVFKPILTGLIVGLVVTLGVIVILAVVLSAIDLPESAAAPLSAFSAMAGAFFAGFLAAKLYRRKGLLIGLLNGFLLFLAFSLIALLFGTSVSVMVLIRLGVMLLASAFGGVLGVNTGKRRKII